AQTRTVTVPSGVSFTVKPVGFAGVDFLRFGGSSCAAICTFTNTQNISVTAVPLANMPVGRYHDIIAVVSGTVTKSVDISSQITTGGWGPLTFTPTSFHFSSAANAFASSHNLQINATPINLAFAYQTNTGFPIGQTVLVAGTGAFSVGTPTVPWINVASQILTAPGSIVVSVNPTGLTASTTPYTGTFTITTSAGSQ